jgi:exodeoxyribonuclease VII small subunit
VSDVGSTESPGSGRTGPLGAGAGSSEPTFEEAQRELDAIVERLERGDADVDELTRLWERGEELYRLCVTKLDNVRGRIEELSRTTES